MKQKKNQVNYYEKHSPSSLTFKESKKSRITTYIEIENIQKNSQQEMKVVEYKYIKSHTHSPSTIAINSSFGQININQKRCSFRCIDLDDLSLQSAESQYHEYMRFNYGSYAFIQKKEESQNQPFIELFISNPLTYFIQLINKDDSSLNIEDYDKEEEEEGNGDILNFLEKSKMNTYKNIIFAFFKHIQECTDPEQQEKYVQLTQDKWEYKHISLRVYQNLRNCGRSNLKIKNLIQNRNLKGVFINFLENSERLWIEQSKIKDKEGFKKQVNLIIQAYKQDLLAKKIMFYKKHKK